MAAVGGSGSGFGSDAVDLTGLEVIRLYSLAIRQPTASREQLQAALRADLAWLEGRPAGTDRAPAAPPTAAASPTPTPAPTSTPAPTPPASARKGPAATRRPRPSPGRHR